MNIKVGITVLIQGIEFYIKEILHINTIESTWDIRVALKQQNIDNRKSLEKALIEGKEPEEAIAYWFYEEKQKAYSNYESVKNPDYRSAQEEIRKLIYIDGLDPIEIIDCLAFSFKSPFWKNQIISLCGLRKRNKEGIRKIDNLRLAMQRKREDIMKKAHGAKQTSTKYEDLD